jgi:hypothetical protein
MTLEGNATAGQELVGSINSLSVLTINAYGIAVKNGFKGTEEEWLMSLEANPERIKQFVNEYMESHPVSVDTTLTIEGMAADAKATGEAIAKVVTDASELIARHQNAKNNPHNVTAEQIGLSEVNNTSDRNKPVSIAQAEAIADAKSAGINAQSAVDSLTTKVPKTEDVLLRSGGTMTGNIEMSGNHITGLPTPTEDSDIITKAYMETYINTTFLGGEW